MLRFQPSSGRQFLEAPQSDLDLALDFLESVKHLRSRVRTVRECFSRVHKLRVSFIRICSNPVKRCGEGKTAGKTRVGSVIRN